MTLVKNPFKRGTALPDVASAPDWHTHPDLLSHQARLARCREKLPHLAHALASAEQAYHEAENAFDQAEMLYLAGRTSDSKTVDEARKVLDAAKKAYAIARLDHSECANEHAELERTAQQVEEDVRAQVARTLSDDFMQLLDTAKQAIEAAADAQEAMMAYQAHIQAQFPGWDVGDYAFNPKLGLAITPLNDLQKPSQWQGETRLTQWQANYARIVAERDEAVKPIPPHARMTPPNNGR